MRSWLILSIFAALHLSCGVWASLVDDFINALVNATDCDSCHALSVVMKEIALLGDDHFVNAWITACETLGVRHLYISESEPP
jgi:hypothetical protein